MIVAVAEFFFHIYLINAHVVEKKKSDFNLYKRDKLNYNTETGGELYPYGKLKRADNSSGGSGTVNCGYNESINNQDSYGGYAGKDKNNSDR